MLLDGTLGDPQSLRNPGVRSSLRHQLQHLTLPSRQSLEPVLAAPHPHELLHDRRIDHRTAVDHPIDRVNEVVNPRDPVLQDIADTPPRREEFDRLVNFGVRRKHQDCHLGEVSPNHARRVEAVRRLPGRHSNINDREVGLVVMDDAQQISRIADLSNDLEPRPLQQACHAFAQQDVVISHHDTPFGSYGVHPARRPGPASGISERRRFLVIGQSSTRPTLSEHATQVVSGWNAGRSGTGSASFGERAHAVA